MPITPNILDAAETPEEAIAFIEAFARVNIEVIRRDIGSPALEAAIAEQRVGPNWDDETLLRLSGIDPAHMDDEVRAGRHYLHIDVAGTVHGELATRMFLAFTGLSEKQQKSLFPALSARAPRDRVKTIVEVPRLNAWLDWVRRDGFDPAAFITYQRSIATHGRNQNRIGMVGATGAAIAFVHAIQTISPDAIVDCVGAVPPNDVCSPGEVFEWREQQAARRRDNTVKALLLRNGRALVFASSKDANIFMPLDGPFADAADALARFNEVRNDQEARAQVLHEFAVGEVKTATDLNNLHERMGLASRETQTELRTDRFLMMSVLNREILEGGVQRRTMNNRDLTRFSHIFNLHHCWGWDGGRTRHPEHWDYFLSSLKKWCGL